MTDIYLNNDHTLVVSGLLKKVPDGEDTPLTSATIAFQIYDSDDTSISGASGTLSQIGTSNDYSAEVDKTIVNLLTKGDEYYISLTGNDGGYDFEFNIDVRAIQRGRG